MSSGVANPNISSIRRYATQMSFRNEGCANYWAARRCCPNRTKHDRRRPKLDESGSFGQHGEETVRILQLSGNMCSQLPQSRTTWANSARNQPNLRRSRPMLGRLRQISPELGTGSAMSGPISTKFWPQTADIGLGSANIGLSSVKLGASFTNIEQVYPGNGQNVPEDDAIALLAGGGSRPHDATDRVPNGIPAMRARLFALCRRHAQIAGAFADAAGARGAPLRARRRP